MNPKYQKVLSDIEKAEKKKSESKVRPRSRTAKRQSRENLEITITFGPR